MTHEHVYDHYVGFEDGMISARCRCGAVTQFPAAARDRIAVDGHYALKDGSVARVTSIDSGGRVRFKLSTGRPGQLRLKTFRARLA